MAQHHGLVNPNWGQSTAFEQSPVQFWSLWWICRQVRVCTVSARLLVTQIRRTGFDSLGTLRSHNVNMLFHQNSESVPITSTFSTISTPQHILNQCQWQWTLLMSENQNEISRVQRRGSLNSHLRRDIEGFAHIRVPLCMCMCVTRGAWAQIVSTAFPILKSSLMHCAHDLPIQVHVLFLILIAFSPPSPPSISSWSWSCGQLSLFWAQADVCPRSSHSSSGKSSHEMQTLVGASQEFKIWQRYGEC